MISILKKMFGRKPAVDYIELISEGGVILDVRTKDEFKYGHIEGSINIPVQELSSKMGKLNKQKAVITCCASGIRSANAKSMLKAKGFEVVHNGGGWASLNRKLNK